MRRATKSLLVLLSAAALVTGMAGAASASSAISANGCVAYAEPPHLLVGSTSGLYSTGTFTCAADAPGMTITVCIEEQYSPTAPWWSRGCTTHTDLEARSTISATHRMSIPVYFTYLRATVYGSNAYGQSASFTTPPVPWFNCACYIG